MPDDPPAPPVSERPLLDAVGLRFRLEVSGQHVGELVGGDHALVDEHLAQTLADGGVAITPVDTAPPVG